MIEVFRNSEMGEYVVRIEKGEELVTKVLEFCKEQDIHGAWLQGIGGCDRVEIGFYDLERNEYEKKVYEEDLELLSMIGNIAENKDDRMLHAHVSLGRRDFSIIGGHLFLMRISIVGEVFIRTLSGRLNREYDPLLRVNVLDPSR